MFIFCLQSTIATSVTVPETAFAASLTVPRTHASVMTAGRDATASCNAVLMTSLVSMAVLAREYTHLSTLEYS